MTTPSSHPDVELITLSSPEEVAQAGAEWWLDQWTQETSPPSLPSPSAALSGGRVAGKFFSATAQLARSNPAPWQRAHFFWADERCVAGDDAESNYRLAKENLLQPLRIPDAHIHRLIGEMDPAAAAARAVTDLHENVAASPGSDCPILAIVFLGMGEDGHVASLFPGGKEAGEEPGLIYPVVASKPPPQRLTMSYRLLSSAREVVVLASGQAKTEALRASLTGSDATPLGRLLSRREHTLILTDIPL